MIRIATRADAPDIAKVHVESWQTTYHNIVKPEILKASTLEKRTKLWEMILQENQHYVLVALNDGNQLIGFIDSYLPQQESIGDINAFYILQAYQRQWIGKKLLKQVLLQAQKQQCQELKIEVFNENPNCIFYEKMGAICIDEKDAAEYGNNLKTLIYSLDVN